MLSKENIQINAGDFFYTFYSEWRDFDQSNESKELQILYILGC
jgi:hypothetical protein